MKNLLEGLEARTLFSGDPNGIPLVEPDWSVGRAGGDYQLGGRWSSTSTSGSTGASGTPITLTWGFVPDGQLLMSGGAPGNGEPNVGSTLRARLTTLYGAQATWQAIFQSVFDRWSQVSGVTYVFQPLDDGAAFPTSSGSSGVRPDLRIGGHPIDGTFNVLAYNYFPNTGDMVIDTDEFNAGGFFTNTGSSSLRLRNVIAHEHGHGMGLSHVDPISNTKLMEAFASTSFNGPQFDDILAAQSLYGDPLEKNGRNESAATATDLGTLFTGTNQTLQQQISIANTSDSDYFKFTVNAGQTVSFTLQPDGPTYLQGSQGGATSSFNAAAQGNLNLSLFASNGTTLLQSANTNGIGAAESLNALGLPAGTYYLRANMSAGSTQMYKLMTTVFDGLGPPSTPDLAATSDLGSSNTDNITADNTPTFLGTSLPNLAIQLFDGATQVGSTTADATGNWVVTSDPLSDGVHSITAKAFDGVTLSSASFSLSVSIDTVAPVITSSTYDREITQRVTLVVGEAAADQISSGELTLTNTTTATTVPIASVTVSGGNTIATVTFSGGLLANGRYALSMPATAITDLAGNSLATPLSLLFVQLAGDANNDAVVNFDDLLVLAQNYNTTNRTFSQGNFNYDASGIVDFSDLLILAQNYNASLFQSSSLIGNRTQTKRRTNPTDVLT